MANALPHTKCSPRFAIKVPCFAPGVKNPKTKRRARKEQKNPKLEAHSQTEVNPFNTQPLTPIVSPCNKVLISVSSLLPPMGARMSFLHKSGSQARSSPMDDIFVRYFSGHINDFEQFHIAFLDLCNNMNSRLPGRRYDAPPAHEIRACYEKWKDASSDAEQKQALLRLMKEHVRISPSYEDAILMTGLLAPPTAMILKRIVPDVIFVPSFTLIAVFAVKSWKRDTISHTREKNGGSSVSMTDNSQHPESIDTSNHSPDKNGGSSMADNSQHPESMDTNNRSPEKNGGNSVSKTDSSQQPESIDTNNRSPEKNGSSSVPKTDGSQHPQSIKQGEDKAA